MEEECVGRKPGNHWSEEKGMMKVSIRLTGRKRQGLYTLPCHLVHLVHLLFLEDLYVPVRITQSLRHFNLDTYIMQSDYYCHV